MTEKLFVIKYHTMMNARPKKFSLAYLASLLIQCHISQYTHYSNFKLASRVPRKCYPCGGIFFSKQNNLKSTIYISSPVLPGPAVYFIMCQYEERENLSVKMELHYVSSPTNHIRIRRGPQSLSISIKSPKGA